MRPPTSRRSSRPVGALRVSLLFLSSVAPAAAQGDGPRVYTPAPAGINALSLTFMGLSSNFNFAQSILIEDADIDSDVWALSYTRFFSLGGRLAQLWVTGIAGSVNGGGTVGPDPPPILPFPPGTELDIPTVSGWADPYVALRVGLMGAPALGLEEFMRTPQEFQLYALLGASIPVGDYSSADPLNLGTNRWAFRLGAPMVIPLASPESRTSLEIVPSLYIYTDNDDPFRADLREQAPLFVVESHLTRNFTDRLWAGLDLRYQTGGGTTTDGVSDENRIGSLGGGPVVVFQIAPFFQLFGSYGAIFAENDGSNGEMWRFRASLLF